MENKKEDLVPISSQELCAEKLLMWSLNVQDLPPEFLMMYPDHPRYYEFVRWLTKYQLAIHCITDLEIGCCEDIAEAAIKKYITDVNRQDLKRIFNKKAKRGKGNES